MASLGKHTLKSRFSLGEICNEGVSGETVAVEIHKRKRDSSISRFAGAPTSNHSIAQPPPLTFSKGPKSRRSINLGPKPQKENQGAAASSVTFKQLPPRRRQRKSLLAEGLTGEEGGERELKEAKSKQLKELENEVRRLMDGMPLKEDRKMRRMEDFQVKEILGEGTFSVVKLVQEKATRSMFALKILDKKYMQEERMENRMAEEIKIQSFLNHPNIVKLYGVLSDADYVYLVQQFAGKNTLYALMLSRQDTGFTMGEVTHLVGQLCQAVKNLHSYSIIHRDIKPQNILLYDDLLKLSDFGWSVHNPDQELRKTICGTPLYMSPEVLTAEFYDEGVDLWAIGVLIYELLTGKLPFNIQRKEDLKNIVTQEADLTEISDPLACSFVKELLVKDRKFRKSIDQICHHPFLEGWTSRYGR